MLQALFFNVWAVLLLHGVSCALTDYWFISLSL